MEHLAKGPAGKRKSDVRTVSDSQLEELQYRLTEAQETLEAIRKGEVDALVVHGPQGQQVYTLSGADYNYRVLVERMNEGAVTLSFPNSGNIILYANKRFAELVGRPLEQVIGNSFREFIVESQQDLLNEMIANGASNQVRCEFDLHDATNQSKRVLLSISSPTPTNETRSLIVTDLTKQKEVEMELREIQAKLESRVAERTQELVRINEQLLREIDERRKAESQLQRMNYDLEGRVQQRTSDLSAANKELEAFSYSVSHDLRAPLRAIHSFARMLLEDYMGKLDEHGQHYLKVIDVNAHKMGELVDHLLEFSRLNKKTHAPQYIDMTALFKEIFTEQYAAESNRGRSVDFKMETLHSSHADPVLIRQVIINLLSNALKFTRHKERAEISVYSEERGNEIIYAVKDNGAGFSMMYGSRLFGVFQRLHREEEFEGTGVGLAFCKRIIERHGGKIWADGEEGKGATFYFSLPK